MTRVFWTERGKQVVHDTYSTILRAWPEAHEELRVPTCEGATFVVAAGSVESPAMVLLHGGMATSAMWLRDIGFWAKDYRVLAVDIIGDAGFSAPSRPAMKSDAHAAWLSDVLAALEITQAHVVGASLGGWIALDFAIRRPELIGTLFLLAPAGIGRLRPRFLLKAAPLLFLGPWGHRKALSFDMGFDTSDTGQDDLSFPRFFKLVASNFVARMRPIPIFADDMLSSINVPTMIIVGEEDEVIDSEETKRRAEEHMAKAIVHSVAGVGHGLEVPTTEVSAFVGKHISG
jgi:pimeloyl-ACP methyl ester carboxylesterase